MSPGTWVAIILGGLALCWIVAIFEEIANGSSKERAQADMEKMLREADK